jgi:hypothetical protein
MGRTTLKNSLNWLVIGTYVLLMPLGDRVGIWLDRINTPFLSCILRPFLQDEGPPSSLWT